MSEIQNEACSAIEGLHIDYMSRMIRPTMGARVAGKGGGGIGGISLDPLSYREFRTDSNLERRTALQASQYDHVVHVQDQPITTSYFDGDGVECQTTWDFAETHDDGTVELIAVKTLAVAEKPGFQDTFRRMCEGIDPGVADSARLVTEWNLKEPLVDRGELFHRALIEPKPSEADAALRFIASQEAPVVIQKVCDHLRDGEDVVDPAKHIEALSRGFWAVVWLLAKRKIKMIDEEFLNTRSEVVLA